MSLERIILNIKLRKNGFYNGLYLLAKGINRFRLPYVKPLGAFLYYLREVSLWGWYGMKSKLYCEQLLRYRCTVGKNVTIDRQVPYIYGHGRIEIGDGVHIGNRNTWVVGLKVYDDPVLMIGNHTTLGYMNAISVAQKVIIGNNCLLAGEIKIFDNNSHPVDPQKRKNRDVMEKSDVAPVIIEDDVWIGTNSLIMKGVTIGKGAVVAAGSVVTTTVPPYTVVGGNPARPLKVIEPYYSQWLSSPEGQGANVPNIGK
jgi:acetyltransferase-like isoleucine patch superfamily enzyme